MVGSIIGAVGADRFGRKWLIGIGLVITYVSVTLEVVATSMALFFTGKTINGIALGIYASVAVTYISEVTPYLPYTPAPHTDLLLRLLRWHFEGQ